MRFLRRIGSRVMKLEEMIFDLSGPKIDSSAVQQLEELLQAELPADYRQFLLLHNGGLSKLMGCDQPYLRIRHWYSACDKAQEKRPGLTSLWELYQQRSKRHGADYLAIGRDLAGMGILLKLRDDHQHAIFYWDWENEGPNQATILFRSFTEMITNCEYLSEG